MKYKLKYLSTFVLTCFFLIILLNNLTIQLLVKVDKQLNDDNGVDLTENIIFTETNSTRERMSFRELCAIESAAKHNPQSKILVFSIKATIHDSEIFKKHKNIKFKLINLNETFNNTVLHEFWFKNKLSAAIYPIFRVSHLSDALRFLLIYKYGGVYSDLDTITIKDFSFIRKFNGFGTLENPQFVQAGVLHFSKKHPFILKCLNSFNKNYNGKVWAANGPLLIQKELAIYCNQTNFKHLLFNFNKSRNKCDVGIYPSEYFYPYPWNEYKALFQKNATFMIKKFLNTFSVHFYGKMSGAEILNENENSLFEYFASSNCPLSYSQYILNKKL